MKFSEWENAGRWYCADTSDLIHDSSAWWLPCRALGVSPADFVKLLAENFKCSHISWYPETRTGNGILIYSWDNQSDMRKFKNYINKIARDKQFLI